MYRAREMKGTAKNADKSSPVNQTRFQVGLDNLCVGIEL